MRETNGGRSLHRPRRACLLVLCLLGGVMAGPASAAIVHVPAGQPNIRAAVAAAASGDTILLAPGLHSGGAFVDNKALTIASQYMLTGDTTAIAQTILDGVASNACGGAPGCIGNAVLEYGTNASGSVVIGLTLSNGENGIASGSIMDVSHCRVVQNGDGVDYVIGSGGTISNCLFEGNSDDGVDLNGRLSCIITNNLIRNNADDGIEFRLYAFSGSPAIVDIIANTITGNGEDGIQIIDYPGTHPYVMRVERNVLSSNFDASGLSAAIGIMPNGDTIESLVGAPMGERLYVINNTIINEKNGLVGGANVIALNNIFSGVQGSAIRRLSGSSIASYTMLWNNGVHYEQSVVDEPHMMIADPVLDPGAGLTLGSPAIDAGTASFQWLGETVLDLPPTAYQGIAPDLGATEFGGIVNSAPVVNAGADHTVTLPSPAILDGAIEDDGLPDPPAAVTGHWNVVSASGPMVIQDPEKLVTQATFAFPGSYVLRLTASDGTLIGSDLVAITVLPSSNAAPTVEAGPPQTITLPADVALDGTVGDDGLPNPPGTLGTLWAKASGPGAVTFQNAGLVDTRAAFSVAGTYQLVLIANDGAMSARDTAQITVLPEPNTAPQVNAGPDRTIALPSDVLLDGTVSDDGHPIVPGLVTTAWTRISGPGTVTFETPTQADTRAAFSVAGTYILRLGAFDGALTGSDLVQVTVHPVNTAPFVDAGLNQTITLPSGATLNGTVTDDGYPLPPGLVTAAWSKVSGPGTVTFGNANLVDTQASFSIAGTYLLRLTASDGALVVTDSVQITVQPQPPPIDRRIAAASDDVEEEVPTGTISGNVSDIELITGTTPQVVGLRFPNITVPPGSTILGAWIQFQADEVQSEVTNLTLQGQAADNAPAFTTVAFNVSSRPRTTAAVSWSPPAWTVVGEQGLGQRTPELKTVIQEIVNRPGWASGNAIAIIVTGTGHRTARSFEGLAAGAALLHIEMGGAPPPPNGAPVVDAGPNRIVTLPASASLDGTVSDDGQPSPPGAVTVTWSKGSGPGTVTFVNANAVDTQASFSLAGTYILRLTASDGALATTDSMQVTVNPPNAAPLVDAGPNRVITLPASAALDGTVTDDGQPSPPSLVTVTWSKGSGPGTVTFVNANAVDTQASFSLAGTYILRLTASDGALATTDSMQVTVNPASNTAPVVDAGPNRVITLPSSALLDGTVADDGQPIPPGSVTTTWSTGSGPGTVTFANANAVDTQASFSLAGTYILRLTASDGALATTDSVQVTVQPQLPPIDRRIAAASDDVEEEVPVGTISGNVTDLELVAGATPQVVGLRFPNITVPPGTTIQTAYIQFEADEVQSEVTNLTLQGQAADNAPAFTNVAFNVSSRPRTTAAVGWSPPAWNLVGEQGPNQRTTELKTVIQEIVNRPGWVSGNAIAIIVTGTGHRTARSFEGLAAGAALLHIEMGGPAPPPNGAPVADAGPNRVITLPASVSLDGTVSDDGLPSPPSLVTTAWSKGSGPGTVTFVNANAVDTQASFSLAGTYILRLTASDGALATTDSMQVTVNPANTPPLVDAGPNRVITLPASASLDGTVTDDGQPSPPAAVTVTWSKGSGPGTVTFVNVNAVDTQASFSIAGTYILRLTASDGALATTDSMQVTVNPANTAPVVDAGPNQTISLPASASLNGTVSDDGLPGGTLTTTWSKGSGPGTVTFGNANAVDTQASFSIAGTYILRLTANDGALATADSVQVTVLPQNFPPTVSAGLDQTIILPASVSLDGTVTDDGLPAPPSLTASWSAVGGPGSVTFGNANAVDTQASFTVPGVYQLRLSASDGPLSAADTVQVTVLINHPLERRVAASTDDAEESAVGSTNLTSANLQLVFNSGNQTVGMRFSTLAIPQGALITSAYVQFTANLVESGATSLLIRAQAADNAAAFVGTTLNVSSRPRTADSVTWTPPAWTTSGQAGLGERTPELKALVQEVVNRPGWVSGNALAIIVRGTGVRTAFSFDGNAAQAPLLHVEYASTSAEAIAAIIDTADAVPRDGTGGGSEIPPGGAAGESVADGIDDDPGGETASADGLSSTGVGADASASGSGATAPPPELALKSVRPSPSRGVVAAEFALPDGSAARLELIDIAGRRIAQREVGSLGPGWHSVELHRGLAAGVYMVRLTQGGSARTTKVAVIR